MWGTALYFIKGKWDFRIVLTSRENAPQACIQDGRDAEGPGSPSDAACTAGDGGDASGRCGRSTREGDMRGCDVLVSLFSLVLDFQTHHQRLLWGPRCAGVVLPFLKSAKTVLPFFIF